MTKLYRKGQAIVMVTLSLFAIVGLIGLAVDLSYAYFLEKTMQAAADSASLAAVRSAFDAAGGITNLNCSNAGIYCTATPTSCSSVVLSGTAGCLYANANGYSPSTPGQSVTMVASDSATAPTVSSNCGQAGATVKRPPTAGCVDTVYWVTVRISQQVPQLFSAILGNYTGTVSARSTAGIVESVALGSLRLLNREGDFPNVTLPPSAPQPRTNLETQGGPDVIVPGGIILSSNSSAIDNEAGRINSNSSNVISPFTWVRTGGSIGGQHYDNWVCTAGGSFCPPIQRGDGPEFEDPFTDRGTQPPLNTSGTLPVYSVPQGALAPNTVGQCAGGATCTLCPGGICAPGIYVATHQFAPGDSKQGPSGQQITIPAHTTLTFSGGTFGDWMFVGGLYVNQSTVLNMGPGRYVAAGVSVAGTPVLDWTANKIQVNGGNSGDPGRIIILTDFRESRDPGPYAGQMDTIYAQVRQHYTQVVASNADNAWNATPWRTTNGLMHGKAAIKSGNNEASRITLYGLNKLSTDLPANMKPFAPVAIWQDQHNSYVKYTQTGQIDTSCPGKDINNPCTQAVAYPDAPELSMEANGKLDIHGAVYQPRGSWINLHAGSNEQGPLQVISGGLEMGGNASLTLTGPNVPVTTYTSSLIE